MLFATILEMIYIMYVLNYFKTKYSIAHPLTYFESDFLHHPIISEEVSNPMSMICPFGHRASWYLVGYILARYILISCNLVNKKSMQKINRYIFTLVLSVSLTNFNAVLYLLPVFLYECKLLTIGKIN